MRKEKEKLLNSEMKVFKRNELPSHTTQSHLSFVL